MVSAKTEGSGIGCGHGRGAGERRRSHVDGRERFATAPGRSHRSRRPPAWPNFRKTFLIL